MAWNESHSSIKQLAKQWGLSCGFVRELFREEPGVIRVVRPETRNKRGYTTMMVPDSVARRVYERITGKHRAA